jgi:hypothetical protein
MAQAHPRHAPGREEPCASHTIPGNEVAAICGFTIQGHMVEVMDRAGFIFWHTGYITGGPPSRMVVEFFIAVLSDMMDRTRSWKDTRASFWLCMFPWNDFGEVIEIMTIVFYDDIVNEIDELNTDSTTHLRKLSWNTENRLVTLGGSRLVHRISSQYYVKYYDICSVTFRYVLTRA